MVLRERERAAAASPKLKVEQGFPSRKSARDLRIKSEAEEHRKGDTGTCPRLSLRKKCLAVECEREREAFSRYGSGVEENLVPVPLNRISIALFV